MIRVLFVFLMGMLLMSCQIKSGSQNGSQTPAVDSAAGLNKALYDGVETQKLAKLPDYEIMYNNNDSRMQRNFTIYIKDYSDEAIIEIVDLLLLKGNKNDIMSINFFDDKISAKNFSENQFNPAISEKERMSSFSHFLYSFKYVPNGSRNISKNVKGVWVVIKNY